MDHRANPFTENIIELILTALRDLVDYELAVILKLENEDTLVVQAAQGPLLPPGLLSHRINLHSRKDLAAIIGRSQPHLFDENEVHIDTYEGILELPDAHSCLAAPLYFGNFPIGLLTLDHSACGKFSPEIVKFIGTLSQLIALIIAQNDSGIALDSLRRDLTRERNLLLVSGHGAFRNMIGKSGKLAVVLDQIRTVSESGLPVLIWGETGTGKEQAARTIHRLSNRSDKPFITLNCSALNASLAESELFGHEKGAFTSAVRKRLGRFEIADGGTLFLDEIGDLPAEIQPKILRTLQEGTFERVGGEQTLHSDVRIIAATNKNLALEVKSGKFREDLYYRLGVFPIHLPPLRERDDDALLLAEHFIREFAGEARTYPPRLSPDAINTILEYPWPGNIRELQNAIQRAVLTAKTGLIRSVHLGLRNSSAEITALEALPHRQTQHAHPAAAETSATVPEGRFATMEEMEREHIRQALARSEGKISGSGGAASLLDMKPSTLQSRMVKLNIKREDFASA